MKNWILLFAFLFSACASDPANVNSRHAASSGPDQLFICKTDSGSFRVFADRDQRLATVQAEQDLTQQFKSGLKIPAYLHIQPITGDAKPGDKAVAFNSWNQNIPANLKPANMTDSQANQLWFNILINFSKDERAGKKLSPGDNIDFGKDGAYLIWKIANSDAEEVTKDGQKEIILQKIPIVSCQAGDALTSVNIVEDYETH